MAYDFFNTSLLAFGKKLTAAFKSLNELKKAAADNVEQVLQDLRVFKQYGNKNYKVPTPYDGTRPCRTDEVYNLISQPFIFKQLEFVNNHLNITGIKFNKVTKRITIFTGSTTITQGSVYYNEAISNNTNGSTLNFYDNNYTGVKVGQKLFTYRISGSTVIILDNLNELNFMTI